MHSSWSFGDILDFKDYVTAHLLLSVSAKEFRKSTDQYLMQFLGKRKS